MLEAKAEKKSGMPVQSARERVSSQAEMSGRKDRSLEPEKVSRHSLIITNVRDGDTESWLLVGSLGNSLKQSVET